MVYFRLLDVGELLVFLSWILVRKIVAVVSLEYALGTDGSFTLDTEILNLFVRMNAA